MGTRAITIIDNTLREGEQTPGVAFTCEEKLLLIGRLVEAGVKAFDAAFPESAPEEREVLAAARQAHPGALVGASCRLIPGTVEAALALDPGLLFVIVPVSDVHLARCLGVTRQEMLGRMAVSLGPAKGFPGLCVVLEDAFRAEEGFLLRCVEEAARLVATRVFLADTVGVMIPDLLTWLHEGPHHH